MRRSWRVVCYRICAVCALPTNVVRNLAVYRRQLTTAQRGKFITAYTRNAAHAQKTLVNLESNLLKAAVSRGE
ncbi:MAG: hypothetical protein QG599_1964 [Pseudomonadota bacterium]|nr:hypothetical protein [Pseudomonadota bacterium]